MGLREGKRLAHRPRCANSCIELRFEELKELCESYSHLELSIKEFYDEVEGKKFVSGSFIAKMLILLYLKRRGKAWKRNLIKLLHEKMNISLTMARKYLNLLEEKGLLVVKEEEEEKRGKWGKPWSKKGPGRPAYKKYLLSSSLEEPESPGKSLLEDMSPEKRRLFLIFKRIVVESGLYEELMTAYYAAEWEPILWILKNRKALERIFEHEDFILEPVKKIVKGCPLASLFEIMGEAEGCLLRYFIKRWKEILEELSKDLEGKEPRDLIRECVRLLISKNLKEFKCTKCGQMIYYGWIVPKIPLECPFCGHENK